MASSVGLAVTEYWLNNKDTIPAPMVKGRYQQSIGSARANAKAELERAEASLKEAEDSFTVTGSKEDCATLLAAIKEVPLLCSEETSLSDATNI